MIFTILGIFFWIFPDFSDLNFYVKTIKNNKNNKKKGPRGPRGCDVARKATWQRHADPRSPSRGAYIYIIYILTYSINGSLSSPIWGGSYPSRSSGLINPTISFLFLRVGLIPTLYLPCR